MRRLVLASSLIAVLVLTAALAAPAFGGPSLSQLATKVARALKLAKVADKRSKKALSVANRALAATRSHGTSGTNGANGTNGTAGLQGAPGPSGATKIDFRATAGTPDMDVFNFGGLVIRARCDAGPNLVINAWSTVDNSEIHLAGVKAVSGSPTPVYSDNDHFGPASGPFSLPSSNFQGTLTYSTPGGAEVTATLAAEQGAFNGAKDCWLGGWAVRDD